MAISISKTNYTDYFKTSPDAAVDNQNYELSEDIDSFPGNLYMKLGINSTFDGKGFTIDFGDDTNSVGGLFQTSGNNIDDASIVKNLGVLGGKTNDSSAFIIRQSQKFFKVINCYSTGLISNQHSGGIVGGYAGANDGDCLIDKCYSSGEIRTNAGGIAGYTAGSNEGRCVVTNCYSTGNISGGNGISGAGAGENGGTCIFENCYTTGNVMGGYSSCFGNLDANNNGFIHVKNCYTTGNSSISNCAGFSRSVGSDGAVVILENCYVTGNHEHYASSSFVSGVGQVNNTSTPGLLILKNCYSTGVTHGFIHRIFMNSVIMDGCYSVGELKRGCFINTHPSADVVSPRIIINKCFYNGLKTAYNNGFTSSDWNLTISNSYINCKDGSDPDIKSLFIGTSTSFSNNKCVIVSSYGNHANNSDASVSSRTDRQPFEMMKKPEISNCYVNKDPLLTTTDIGGTHKLPDVTDSAGISNMLTNLNSEYPLKFPNGLSFDSISDAKTNCKIAYSTLPADNIINMTHDNNSTYLDSIIEKSLNDFNVEIYDELDSLIYVSSQDASNSIVIVIDKYSGTIIEERTGEPDICFNEVLPYQLNKLKKTSSAFFLTGTRPTNIRLPKPFIRTTNNKIEYRNQPETNYVSSTDEINPENWNLTMPDNRKASMVLRIRDELHILFGNITIITHALTGEYIASGVITGASSPYEEKYTGTIDLREHIISPKKDEAGMFYENFKIKVLEREYTEYPLLFYLNNDVMHYYLRDSSTGDLLRGKEAVYYKKNIVIISSADIGGTLKVGWTILNILTGDVISNNSTSEFTSYSEFKSSFSTIIDDPSKTLTGWIFEYTEPTTIVNPGLIDLDVNDSDVYSRFQIKINGVLKGIVAGGRYMNTGGGYMDEDSSPYRSMSGYVHVPKNLTPTVVIDNRTGEIVSLIDNPPPGPRQVGVFNVDISNSALIDTSGNIEYLLNPTFIFDPIEPLKDIPLNDDGTKRTITLPDGTTVSDINDIVLTEWKGKKIDGSDLANDKLVIQYFKDTPDFIYWIFDENSRNWRHVLIYNINDGERVDSGYFSNLSTELTPFTTITNVKYTLEKVV